MLHLSSNNLDNVFVCVHLANVMQSKVSVLKRLMRHYI